MIPAERVLLDQIRTRGHWHVTIRPSAFNPERLGRNELLPLLAQSRVDIRGWDFPHVNPHEPLHIDAEWIGQQIVFEHQLQLWRFYRSGQFLSISGIPNEWRDRSGFWPPSPGWAPNQLLGLVETIARMTEIGLFASSLAQTRAADEMIVVAIELRQMEGRLLFTDSFERAPLRGGHRANVPIVVVTRRIPRAELIANDRRLALEWAEDAFSFFGYRPEPQILADVQAEILKGR